MAKKYIVVEPGDELIVLKSNLEKQGVAITNHENKLHVSEIKVSIDETAYYEIKNISLDDLMCLSALNTFEDHSSNIGLSENDRNNWNNIYNNVFEKIHSIHDENEMTDCTYQCVKKNLK